MIQDLRKYKNGAAKLKDLIQQVLHHLDFDPMDVEHNMHQRLRRAIVGAISKWLICVNMGAEIRM